MHTEVPATGVSQRPADRRVLGKTEVYRWRRGKCWLVSSSCWELRLYLCLLSRGIPVCFDFISFYVCEGLPPGVTAGLGPVVVWINCLP